MATGGLAAVEARVASAAGRSARDPASITLVAVSKTVGPDEIMEAYEAGHRDFGENRSHELLAKAAQLPEDIVWHFVGSLQSRKAKDVAPIASVLHSMDRASLLRAWARLDATGAVLLQVNLAQEQQKHGAARDEVPVLLETAAELGVEISGLMLMPPLVADPEDNRHWFRELREIREGLSVDWPGLTELSMGMTDDFEVAIEEGATLIRVGRAIFGT